MCEGPEVRLMCHLNSYEALSFYQRRSLKEVVGILQPQTAPQTLVSTWVSSSKTR